jgi:hypothetical protein
MEPELIAGLLDLAEDKIAEFRKETYEESFRQYLEDHVPVWNMICDTETDDRRQEQVRTQAVDALIHSARERTENIKGRSKREKMQYQLNLYMVSYVLPAVIAWQKRCNRPEEETKAITDLICGSWQEAFGARIQASDYASIQAGFKQKLCFVTTAVCRGLQKPQDCKEIKLMKQFRDGYFSESTEGKQLIQEYYDIAPTIVKRISKEADPEEKYLYLWDTYIKRCVDYIENDRNEQCGCLYESMMSELKEEYMVTHRQEHKNRGKGHYKDEQAV